MNVTIPYQQGGWIQADPPGSPYAFLIRANNREYLLKKTQGIAVAPNKNNLTYRQTVYFKLIFEPIPIDTKFIDLIEGKIKEPNTYTFDFNKIRLFEEEQDVTRGSITRYFKLSDNSLLPSESYWLVESEFYKIIDNNISDRPIISEDIDTIVSYMDKNKLVFFDLEGNQLRFSVPQDMMKLAYFEAYYQYEKELFLKVNTINTEQPKRLKMKKSTAKKIWKESFDKKAKYYYSFSIQKTPIPD